LGLGLKRLWDYKSLDVKKLVVITCQEFWQLIVIEQIYYFLFGETILR
jgi:hypothetical protein